MADKAIGIQNQIRNNAQSIKDYISDLERWENEINALDNSLSEKKAEPRIDKPLRSSLQQEEESKTKKEASKYKRDETNMFEYYKAWDKFDADEELKQLDELQPTLPSAPAKVALPRSKVVIKGGRSNNSDLDRTKDQATLAFTTKDYTKALELYQKCLDMSPNDEMQVILFSNCSECFLRLNKYNECENYADKALSVNTSHTKSLVRRSKARKMLGKFKLATEDLNAASAIEPKNAIIAQELLKVEKRRKKKIEEIINEMTNKTRLAKFDLASVPVKDVNLTEPAQKKIVEIEEEKASIEKIQDLSKKATESIPVQSIPLPKTISELQRNWAMLSNNKEKLKEYLTNINLNELFMKGGIESDFLMQIIQTIHDYFIDDSFSTKLLEAISKCKNIASVLKFLTSKEKLKITEILQNFSGSPELGPLRKLLEPKQT
ncbi:unnamed protein product [Blepharisma stoltei]|uniref:RNA polymerase II-associated protein 3 n=1 Tax=Blepharisma stoltei TaxID=1481888 RepID=A0AAU9K1J8_9CILI|nr:unnamed protein product [Blepharisma stoltei]